MADVFGAYEVCCQIQEGAFSVPTLTQQADGFLHRPVRRQQVTKNLPRERDRILRKHFADKLVDFRTRRLWVEPERNPNGGQKLGRVWNELAGSDLEQPVLEIDQLG